MGSKPTQPSSPKCTTAGENKAPHLEAHNGGESIQTLPVVSPLGYDSASSLLLPLLGKAAPAPHLQARRCCYYPVPLPFSRHLDPHAQEQCKVKALLQSQTMYPSEELDLLNPLSLGKLRGQQLSRDSSSWQRAGRDRQLLCQYPGDMQPTAHPPGTRAHPADFSFLPPPNQDILTAASTQPSGTATQPQRLHSAACYVKLKKTRQTTFRNAEQTHRG